MAVQKRRVSIPAAHMVGHAQAAIIQ